MAELASVYPTAGGQYHFASILAPRSIRKSVSYACGIITVIAWMAIGASVTIIPGQQLTALAAGLNPDYTIKPLHVFLIYQATGFLVLLYNLFALKKAPWTHDIGFALSIGIFLILFIASLVRSHQGPSSQVFSTFINLTGWPNGVCSLIGPAPTCFMYVGLDAAMHVAEEVKDARRQVPRAIMAAVAIGFCTAFPFIIAQLYAIDIDAILTYEG